MIGTTFKLSFDGTSVIKGISKIGGMFGKLGQTIGRGAMERVGHQMTDLMGRIIAAVPQAIAQTADFAGEINDLATATGESIPNLVKLGEVLRIGGAESVDTGRMLSNMAKNIRAANEEGGSMADAIHALGLETTDFDGMKVDEMFTTIAKAVQGSNKTFGELADILGELFGGRIGYKTISVMKELDTNMARAAKSTSEWGRYLEANAGSIDEIGDAMGRFNQFKMGMASMFFDVFKRFGGSGTMDKLFDFLSPENVRPQVEALFSLIGRNMEALMNMDLSDALRDLLNNASKWVDDLTMSIQGKGWDFGKKIGDGAVSALGDGLIGAFANLATSMVALFITAAIELGKAFGGAAAGAFKEGIMNGGWFDNGTGAGGVGGSIGRSLGAGGGFTSGASNQTKEQLDEQIGLLRDIRAKVGVTAWA